MTKLPAASAILIAVLAAAAPAAQGRRVLVAVERDAHSPAGGALSGALPDGSPTYLVKAPSGQSARRYAERLSRRPGVLAAQVNHGFRLRLAQSGPTGCVPKPDPPDRTVARQINAELADAGGPTKPIAILDTGVDPNVPELAGRVLEPHDVVGGFLVPDQDGHGTEVAGVAASAPGAVRGVSPTSPVFSVRIFNSTGNSSSDIVVSAVTEAVKAGAGVINISAAGDLADATPKDNQVMTVAIAQAFDAGVLVVAPSGNEGRAQPDAPGAYPHVLTVGSGSSVGGRDLFSNSGPWLDLLAPANEIVVPAPTSICESGYASVKGTSYASPAVAGAAAIVQTLRPDLTTQQLFDVMRNAGSDLGLIGWDHDTGFGLLDVAAAVTAATPAPLSQEVDDDIVFAKTKPVVKVKRTKYVKVLGSLSAAKDTTDVYRVRLKKGEKLRSDLTTKVQDAYFSISLYDRDTGDLDLTQDVTSNLLKDSGGLSPNPVMRKRVKKGGIYYLAVETPDTLQDDTTEAIPTDQAYTLKMKRVKPLPTKKKKPKKK